MRMLRLYSIASVLILLAIASCVGPPPGSGGGSNVVAGVCGTSDDALFLDNLYGLDVTVNIGYPDGTSCSQELATGFGSVTRANASFSLGETYTFSATAPDGAALASPTVVCEVSSEAAGKGAARVEVLVPMFTSQLEISCAGNWDR